MLEELLGFGISLAVAGGQRQCDGVLRFETRLRKVLDQTPIKRQSNGRRAAVKQPSGRILSASKSGSPMTDLRRILELRADDVRRLIFTRITCMLCG
jgi:hypothetical protein